MWRIDTTLLKNPGGQPIFCKIVCRPFLLTISICSSQVNQSDAQRVALLTALRLDFVKWDHFVVDLLLAKTHCNSGQSLSARVWMRDSTPLAKTYPVTLKRVFFKVVWCSHSSFLVQVVYLGALISSGKQPSFQRLVKNVAQQWNIILQQFGWIAMQAWRYTKCNMPWHQREVLRTHHSLFDFLIHAANVTYVWKCLDQWAQIVPACWQSNVHSKEVRILPFSAFRGAMTQLVLQVDSILLFQKEQHNNLIFSDQHNTSWFHELQL